MFLLCVREELWLRVACRASGIPRELLLKTREIFRGLPTVDGDESGLIFDVIRAQQLRAQQLSADVSIALSEEHCPGAGALACGDEAGELFWLDDEFPEDDVHFHFPA
jgi:hypothetical protein